MDEKNPTADRKNRLKFLVVDDSRAMRSYVSSALKAIDCTIIEARSGFEALRFLPRESFDMVITDINMPDINGHELIRLIRGSERFSDVAVLIISTQASERDQKRVLQLGASRFLAKPFTPSELINAVEELLKGQTKSDPS